MKVALSWLESYCTTKPNWDVVFDKLTMAGFEVEGVSDVVPPFSGIVVAEVISCEPHPNADKLTLCKVDYGSGELVQIICGAANVAPGIKVPCAKVGAVLPDGLVIAPRKMRGITSFGMLCSGDEIACPNDVDGLLILDINAPIGYDIRSYLGLNDKIIEFKITPNRGDCLSISGLLREIKALTDTTITPLQIPELTNCTNDKINVVMQAQDICPNYVTLVIKGINNKVVLPEHISRYLVNSGLRSVSPVVDITNFVMLSLGQPLHAFDMHKVGQQLHVRLANSGEQLRLLDGKTATFNTNTLLICDSSNQPAAIAGVMGGADSGISDATTDIILESAFFVPEAIAGLSKYYGVHSDSAYRFERGVDPQLQTAAIKFAAAQITEYCGGIVGEINVTAKSFTAHQLTVDYTKIRRLLGIDLTNATINSILQSLDFIILDARDDSLLLEVPSFRFDIKIAEDVVEEIARVYGYDNVAPIMPTVVQAMQSPNTDALKLDSIKQSLVDLGYNEIIAYAFLEDKLEKLYGNLAITPICLQNPIAGLNVMRTSLIADLVKAFVYNVSRGAKALKLFEVANVFYGDDAALQPLKLAGLVYGEQAHWSTPVRNVDFFDLKNHISLVLAGFNDLIYVPCSAYPVLHSGRCAKIYYQNQELGIIGQLHPKFSQELGMTELPYCFELDLTTILRLKKEFNFVAPNKSPKVVRDLAFVVADAVLAGSVVQAIRDAAIADLQEINIFDVYYGVNLPVGYKSIAFNFVFQAEKTLIEEEINAKLRLITDCITAKFNAQLR